MRRMPMLCEAFRIIIPHFAEPDAGDDLERACIFPGS